MKNKKCPNCLCIVDPTARSCPYCKTALKSDIQGFLPKIDFKTPEVIAQNVQPLHNTKATAELQYLPPLEEDKVNIGDFLEVDVSSLQEIDENNQLKPIDKNINDEYVQRVISLEELPNHEIDIEEVNEDLNQSSEFDFNGSLMQDIKAYFDLNDTENNDYEKSHSFLIDKLSIDDIVQGSIQADKKEKKDESFGLMFGSDQGSENTEELPSYNEINQAPKIYDKSLEKKDYNSLMHDTLDTSLDALGFVDDDSDFKELKNKLAEPDPTLQSISNNIIENIPLKLRRFQKDKNKNNLTNEVKINIQNTVLNKDMLFELLKIRTEMFIEGLNKEDPYYYPPFEIDNLEISEIRDYEYQNTEYEFSEAFGIDVNPDFLKELNDFVGVSEIIETLEEDDKEISVEEKAPENTHESTKKDQPIKSLRDTISELENLKMDLADDSEILKDGNDQIIEEIDTDFSSWFGSKSEEVGGFDQILNEDSQDLKPLFDLGTLKIDSVEQDKENTSKTIDTETIKTKEISKDSEQVANLDHDDTETNDIFFFNTIALDSLTSNLTRDNITNNKDDTNEFSYRDNLNFEGLQGLQSDTDTQEKEEIIIQKSEEILLEKNTDFNDNFSEIELPDFARINLEVTIEDSIETQKDLLESKTIETDGLEKSEDEIEIPSFFQEIENLNNVSLEPNKNIKPENVKDVSAKISLLKRLGNSSIEHIESNEELLSVDLNNIPELILKDKKENDLTSPLKDFKLENDIFGNKIELVAEANSLRQTFTTNSQSQNLKQNIPDLPKEIVLKDKTVIKKDSTADIVKDNVISNNPVFNSNLENNFNIDNPAVGSFQPEPFKLRNPITTTLNTTLGARGTNNDEAMSLYISARDLCLKKEYHQALDELEKSVKLDPAFEQAHILLSRTYLKIKNIY